MSASASPEKLYNNLEKSKLVLAVLQSEAHADRAELLPNRSADSCSFGAVRDCRCEQEAPRFRSFVADKELSGCQQLREEKVPAGDPINTTKDCQTYQCTSSKHTHTQHKHCFNTSCSAVCCVSTVCCLALTQSV